MLYTIIETEPGYRNLQGAVCYKTHESNGMAYVTIPRCAGSKYLTFELPLSFLKVATQEEIDHNIDEIDEIVEKFGRLKKSLVVLKSFKKYGTQIKDLILSGAVGYPSFEKLVKKFVTYGVKYEEDNYE